MRPKKNIGRKCGGKVVAGPGQPSRAQGPNMKCVFRSVGCARCRDCCTRERQNTSRAKSEPPNQYSPLVQAPLESWQRDRSSCSDKNNSQCEEDGIFEDLHLWNQIRQAQAPTRSRNRCPNRRTWSALP